MTYFKDKKIISPDLINQIRTKFQAFKNIVIEYCEESSIHGFKYIGERKRPFFDRIIWLLAVIISILLCYYLIGNIFNQRTKTPVIVTFNEKVTPVWDIPFPTVTICPETKYHKSLFNYTDVYFKFKYSKSATKEEAFMWDAISQTCIESFFYFTFHSFLLFISEPSDLIKAMLTVAPTLDETLSGCSWKKYNERVNESCQALFDTILTNEGICFTFNSLKSKYYSPELLKVRKADFIGTRFENDEEIKWDLENGYDPKANEDAFPYRVLDAGDMQSLFLTLADRIEDKQEICRKYFQGFKILFHTPGEDIQVLSKNYVSVPLDQSVSIAITPKVVTSDDLRHYTPEERQCYYQDEPKLMYFTVYTQANCELEWLNNATLLECECLRIGMPRNTTHPVCGYDSQYCVETIASYHSILAFRREKNIELDYFCKERGSCKSFCLPTCFSIEYKAEISHQNEIDYAQVLKTNVDPYTNFRYNYSKTRISQVRIHFKDHQFNGLKRSELYSTTDLIANCGGLLGLFMGVSILSMVEFVYFFTLRILTNWKNKNKIQEKRSSRNNAFWARSVRRPKIFKIRQSKPNSSIRFRKQKTINRY
ncbi:pickpocket protein 28-like [Episyrphus balteatus]|uniref:pickpocket protein 28-like n=1 Tax=Episyrphus balteatus TaxID=286459 RepID=UPI002486B008|nr:pickpocket protein 28-like [Episyrphus balteatus]